MPESQKNQAVKWKRGGLRPNQTGRPKGTGKKPEEKAITVSLSMSAEMHRAIKSHAEKNGETFNNIIRLSLKNFLKSF
jgi:hypothetical protein